MRRERDGHGGPTDRATSDPEADLLRELGGQGTNSKPQHGTSPSSPRTPALASQALDSRTPLSPAMPKTRRLKFKSGLAQIHTPGAALRASHGSHGKGIDTLFQRAQDQFELNRAQACPSSVQSPTHHNQNRLGLRNQVYVKHGKQRLPLAQATPASAFASTLNSPHVTGHQFKSRYQRGPSAAYLMNIDL